MEDIFKSARDADVSAGTYPSAKADMELNLIEIVKAQVMYVELRYCWGGEGGNVGH